MGRVAKELLDAASSVAPGGLALPKTRAEFSPAWIESALKKILFPLGLLLAANLSTLVASPAATPSPAPALEVIATNGAGVEKHLFSRDGVVSLLMIRPNQTVAVTLQFPIARAGTPVAATPLDGGQIAGGNPVVLPMGKAVFTFSPGPVPGRYRVVVQTPLEQHLLEFYVVDPNHHPRQQRQ
jgi:hypothetical protein